MANALPTATLGRTGLTVTRLGYSAAHRRSMTHDQADKLLNAVVDSGVNFIDAANDYGNSEELIGKYISNRRSEFYLATKCGCSPNGHVWTKENMFRGLEESLERMKPDYIDVMQMHNPTVEECEKSGLIDALDEMREQGKVRWIGVSTTLPHLPTFLDWGVFDIFQIPYSALERDHEEWITASAKAGVGIVLRSGLALGEPGVGTGKEDRWGNFNKAGLNDLLERGESRSAFLLRYTLTHPHTDIIIVGTTNPDHLAKNVAAIDQGPLSAEVYQDAKRRMDAIGESPTPVG